MYEYEWIPGALAPTSVVEEMAALYSEHYGVWGQGSGREGQPIRLSVLRLLAWLTADSRIAIARDRGKIAGYAIAVWTKLPRRGVVSWVTQFVVHKDYRRQGVGKALLFTIWHFSNHFAWGLVTQILMQCARWRRLRAARLGPSARQERGPEDDTGR
jgi:GNAT superfamily N-acetyltransferase